MSFFKRNAANLVTCIRIPCAIGIFYSQTFSPSFYFFLLLGGLSDALDGYIARKISGDTPLGATLDSISDVCFFGSTILTVLLNKSDDINSLAWRMLISVAIIRLFSYMLQLIKFKELAPLHTLLNKITSGLIFTTLFFIPMIGLSNACIISSFVGLLGGVEEIIIHSLSKKPRANVLSLYCILKERK